MSLFSLSTREGYIIKELIGLLEKTITSVSFILSKDGITLTSADSRGDIMDELTLIASKFDKYHYHFKKATYAIGLNIGILQSLVNSIKKKDAITMSIAKADPQYLIIKTSQKTESTSIERIKILAVQNLKYEIPRGYNEEELGIAIKSSEYQQTCKKFKKHRFNQVTIKRKGRKMSFFGCLEGVFSSEKLFSDDDDEDEEESEKVVVKVCKLGNLLRLMKLSGLSGTTRVRVEEGLPIVFESSVGSFGDIKIYVKSIEKGPSLESNYSDDSDG